MHRNWTRLAWASILLVFLLSWGFWVVPVSWYGVRDWLFLLLAIPLVNVAGIVAFRTRNRLLGAATVLSVFAPFLIIFVSLLMWGL